MLDHHDARMWADHHHEFGDWVRRTLHLIGDAFKVLAAIQYAEPWKTTAAKPDSASRNDGSVRRCPA